MTSWSKTESLDGHRWVNFIRILAMGSFSAKTLAICDLDHKVLNVLQAVFCRPKNVHWIQQKVALWWCCCQTKGP